MTRKLLFLGLVSCFVASAATNLVQNGTFSTGSFTDWTTHTCATCEAAGWNVTTSLPTSQGGTPPPAATAAAITACVGALCNDPVNGDDLSQTLTTVAGQIYTLSFYYDAGADSGAEGTTELEVLWNGSPVTGGTIVNAAATSWALYSFNVTATGTSTVLEFTGRQDPATLYLTNVSVTAGATVTPPATPVPNTLLLLISGLALVSTWATRDRIREFFFHRSEISSF